MAQEADRAGYAMTASHLVHLACAVFDDRGHSTGARSSDWLQAAVGGHA